MSYSVRSAFRLSSAWLQPREAQQNDPEVPLNETCVACDETKKLACPETCPAGTECTFRVPIGCPTRCQASFCDPIVDLTPSQQPKESSTNVGAIAGGVVGGIAVVAVIAYLIWRFCVKPRRDHAPVKEIWEDSADHVDGDEKSFSQRRDYRASTHTVHSIASTVLTRASNIIQIAYIPGVTNRATSSPTVLVPPVPPIPISISQASTPNSTEDQHFFVPGDLRDSTYSGLSSYTDRTSYARTSYAPRSSVASTIYGKSAVVVAPAQTGMRAKPAMVSVRSANSNNSTGTSTPPVPSVDYEKYAIVRPPSPANSTFSVGSTFLNNASTHTATPARAMVVRVGSVKRLNSNKTNKSEDATLTSPITVSGSTIRDSTAATIIVDSPQTNDLGPFSDPPKPSSQSAISNSNLSAVIEEATRRASQRDSSLPIKGRERSPFGDEHAAP